MDSVQTFPVSVADQPHKDTGAANGSSSLTAAEFKAWVREILDWILKLLPVIATIALAILADQYKASLTTSTLLSEREKADSQLRTEMFSRLVDPISGAKFVFCVQGQVGRWISFYWRLGSPDKWLRPAQLRLVVRRAATNAKMTASA